MNLILLGFSNENESKINSQKEDLVSTLLKKDLNEGSKVEESMDKQLNMMEKFNFLLGNWNLEYRVPKSAGRWPGRKAYAKSSFFSSGQT